MCGCPRDQLCDLCRAGLFDNLRGTAACRGERWADEVARVVPRDRPWPAWNDRVAAIARRKVEDMARDERLLVLFAAELATWAAKRWDALKDQGLEWDDDLTSQIETCR